MTPDIRRIRSSDAEAFHACLDAVARERRYLAQTEAPPIERVRQFVAESAAQDAAQYVAVVGEQVVGWCDVFAHWADALRHVGTLGMGVLPAYRGQGLGRRLLRRTLEHALHRGIFRVALEARADNERAIRLYESVGFRHEGLAPCALRFDGVFYPAVKMALLQGPVEAAQQTEVLSPEAVVREFWRLMASNDFHSVAAVLASEFVLEWPQSRERIRGAERFCRMNAEYPTTGRWRFELQRLVADGESVVTQVDITDGTQTAQPVSFFTVRAGRITRLVEVWPEPFAPAENRRHLVEPMD